MRAAPGGRRSGSGERRPFPGGRRHCWQGAHGTTGQNQARHSPRWHGVLLRGHRSHRRGQPERRAAGTESTARGLSCGGQGGGCATRGRSTARGSPRDRAGAGQAALAQAEQGSVGDRSHARAPLGDTGGTGQRSSGTRAAQGRPRCRTYPRPWRTARCPHRAIPVPGAPAPHRRHRPGLGAGPGGESRWRRGRAGPHAASTWVARPWVPMRLRPRGAAPASPAAPPSGSGSQGQFPAPQSSPRAAYQITPPPPAPSRRLCPRVE